MSIVYVDGSCCCGGVVPNNCEMCGMLSPRFPNTFTITSRGGCLGQYFSSSPYTHEVYQSTLAFGSQEGYTAFGFSCVEGMGQAPAGFRFAIYFQNYGGPLRNDGYLYCGEGTEDTYYTGLYGNWVYANNNPSGETGLPLIRDIDNVGTDPEITYLTVGDIVCDEDGIVSFTFRIDSDYGFIEGVAS